MKTFRKTFRLSPQVEQVLKTRTFLKKAFSKIWNEVL